MLTDAWAIPAAIGLFIGLMLGFVFSELSSSQRPVHYTIEGDLILPSDTKEVSR